MSPEREAPDRQGLRRRLWRLAITLLAAAAVAGVGVALTGSDGWWLALPVGLAAMWLFTADPTRCVPPPPLPPPPQPPSPPPPPR